jgi:hypothetical protein
MMILSNIAGCKKRNYMVGSNYSHERLGVLRKRSDYPRTAAWRLSKRTGVARAIMGSQVPYL